MPEVTSDPPLSMSLQTIEAEGDAYQIVRAIGEAGAGAYHDVVTRLARFKALERD